MYWIKTTLNFFSSLGLAVFGAILGGEYTKAQYAAFLIFLIAEFIAVQMLLNSNKDLQQERDSVKGDLGQRDRELKTAKDKLSTILLQSTSKGENTLQVAIQPVSETNRQLTVGVATDIRVMMNSPYDVLTPPDLKIYTDVKWGSVKIGATPVFPHKFGDQYEYILPGSSFTNLHVTSNRYFSVQFSVIFNKNGVYQFTLEAVTQQLRAQIRNSLEVGPAFT